MLTGLMIDDVASNVKWMRRKEIRIRMSANHIRLSFNALSLLLHVIRKGMPSKPLRDAEPLYASRVHELC